MALYRPYALYETWFGFGLKGRKHYSISASLEFNKLFIFQHYRFYAKTLIGESTIQVLKINDIQRHQKWRFGVGSEIKEKLDELKAQLEDHLAQDKILKKEAGYY